MTAILAMPKQLPAILRSVSRPSDLFFPFPFPFPFPFSLLPHPPHRSQRPFRTSVSPLLGKSKNLPPRPKPPPEEEIDESFLKGSGPGGQKINKTSSAVQLKHLPTGIVVKSQATRSRSQNRAIARQLLADRLDGLARGDQSRAAVVGAVKSRKKASAAKKSRRKYRSKREGGEGEEGEEGGGEEAEGEEGEGGEGEGLEEGTTAKPKKEKAIRGPRFNFVR